MTFYPTTVNDAEALLGWRSRITSRFLRGLTRTVSKERELTVPGLTDLQGAVWAADGSGWFVTSDTEIGIQMFFVFPDGRFHLLGDIQGWAVPAPDGRRVALMNRFTASNAWLLDRRGASGKN